MKEGLGINDDENGPTLSLDAVLDLLAHHHRRALLKALQEDPDQRMSQTEVISLLQDQEERRVGQKPGWNSLSSSLHHIHGPKMSETGVLTYDETDEMYHYHPDERLEKWLELVESEANTEF